MPLSANSVDHRDALVADDLAEKGSLEAAQEMRSEVAEYLVVRAQRRRILPRAALVGLLSGVLALAFRWCLTLSDKERSYLIPVLHQRLPGFGWLIPILVSAAGAGIAVALVKYIAPEASGSGIPHLEAVLRRVRQLHWQRLLPVKFFGGLLAIGVAGLAMGREGPSVQMGGAVGAGVAEAMGSGLRERETLILAGAGAGLSAAFNAPLAGLVFILEEVQREFTPIVFGAALVATVMADVVARLAAGQDPVFRVPAYNAPPLTALLPLIALGILAGFGGVFFNRSLLKVLDGFTALNRILPIWVNAAAVGALIGLAGWFAPEIMGGGHGLAEQTLAGRIALTVLPLWFLARFALTILSYGTGAPGGVFAPLLALGALLGLATGQVAHLLLPAAVPVPAMFAVVGMAAFFASVVRAPLTGIVLIVEMTGSYALMLPLLVTCFTSYALAEALNDRPLYEALLERDLARQELKEAIPQERESTAKILESQVEHGAFFDGKAVRDLRLPAGCILVTLRNENGERVVTADTRLKAGDKVVAVVASDEGAKRLREGCAPENKAEV